MAQKQTSEDRKRGSLRTGTRYYRNVTRDSKAFSTERVRRTLQSATKRLEPPQGSRAPQRHCRTPSHIPLQQDGSGLSPDWTSQLLPLGWQQPPSMQSARGGVPALPQHCSSLVQAVCAPVQQKPARQSPLAHSAAAKQIPPRGVVDGIVATHVAPTLGSVTWQLSSEQHAAVLAQPAPGRTQSGGAWQIPAG